jgi:hypothetical protein
MVCYVFACSDAGTNGSTPTAHARTPLHLAAHLGMCASAHTYRCAIVRVLSALIGDSSSYALCTRYGIDFVDCTDYYWTTYDALRTNCLPSLVIITPSVC